MIVLNFFVCHKKVDFLGWIFFSIDFEVIFFTQFLWRIHLVAESELEKKFSPRAILLKLLYSIYSIERLRVKTKSQLIATRNKNCLKSNYRLFLNRTMKFNSFLFFYPFFRLGNFNFKF